MNLIDFTGQLYDMNLVKEDAQVKAIIEKYRDLQAGKKAA